MNTHFLEPLDVLFLRGNRPFGEAGSYGESMVPPWPSVAAGAIRSAILARDGTDPAAFASGGTAHETLGTPAEPGPFRLTDFQLAWHGEDAEGPLERLYPLPADLVATKRDEAAGDDKRAYELRPLTPVGMAPGMTSSSATALLPVMAQAGRAKPATGIWLSETGMRRWLAGERPDPERHLVESRRLWDNDERVGIGMKAASRRVDDGRLFSMQAVVFKPGVGLLATVDGDGLADGSLVRLGGDGRAAVVRHREAPTVEEGLEAIVGQRRCRIVLTAPGIFPSGWLPPGCDADGRFELLGVRGRLVCAAVPRAETVSGWDLARWRPKSAHRAAPAGSVYWLEELEASEELLRKLVDHGLWPETGYDAQRRAEGFNRFTFATY